MSAPKPSTIKRLFAVSGNQCAFPRCPLPLVDESSGKVTGRICHIKAQKPGGPRYDSNQSDEERHAFENLLILCPIHHDVIDSDVESYTVERLLQIKAEHEKTHSGDQEPSDEIVSALMAVSLSEGSLILTQNQSGGQVAHRITNVLLHPDVSVSFEREVQARRDAHDLEIFRRSDALLNEDQLGQGFSLLLADHSYRNNFFLALINFTEFFQKVQNQYLNSSLASLSSQVLTPLKELTEFLTYDFWVFPENQRGENTRLCLHPELNMDREGTGLPEEVIKYDEYAEKLYNLVNNVSKAYAAYRKAIKETLFI